jgi:hypothetical protein
MPSEDILLSSKTSVTLFWKYLELASFSRVRSDRKNEESTIIESVSVKPKETKKETLFFVFEKKNFKNLGSFLLSFFTIILD